MSKSRNGSNQKVSWAQAFRDIVIASMRYGQFPFFGFLALLGMAIWKMPGQDVSRLMFTIVEYLSRGYFMGYVLFGLSTGGWFIHAKRQRALINSEMDRIAKEKSELQQQLLGAKIESSRLNKGKVQTKKEAK